MCEVITAASARKPTGESQRFEVTKTNGKNTNFGISGFAGKTIQDIPDLVSQHGMVNLVWTTEGKQWLNEAKYILT